MKTLEEIQDKVREVREAISRNARQTRFVDRAQQRKDLDEELLELTAWANTLEWVLDSRG